jgi:hypothetical protein
MSDDRDIFDDLLLAARLAPIIACGITIWWLEWEWRMDDPGFTVEQLCKLVAMRPIIRKIMTRFMRSYWFSIGSYVLWPASASCPAHMIRQRINGRRLAM